MRWGNVRKREPWWLGVTGSADGGLPGRLPYSLNLKNSASMRHRRPEGTGAPAPTSSASTFQWQVIGPDPSSHSKCGTGSSLHVYIRSSSTSQLPLYSQGQVNSGSHGPGSARCPQRKALNYQTLPSGGQLALTRKHSPNSISFWPPLKYTEG